MAESGQKLSQWGVYLVNANHRVTIDPELRDSNGAVLAPRNIQLIPEGIAICPSRDTGTGTFDIQNITDNNEQIFWYAEYNHSTTQTPFQASQITVGAAGAVTSAIPPLAIEVFDGRKDITVINAGPSAPTVAEMRNGFIELGSAAAHDCTLPVPAALALEDGLEVIFKRNGANLVTITAGLGSTIDGLADVQLPLNNDSVTLVYQNANTNWEIV